MFLNQILENEFIYASGSKNIQVRFFKLNLRLNELLFTENINI